MQHPSPYCSCCPPSHPNFLGSAGPLEFQTPPCPHPHPSCQGDGLSSDPSCLHDVHIADPLHTYNYLFPPQISLDDIATGLQYKLCIENEYGRNPSEPSVSSTTNFLLPEYSVPDPTVDHNAHSYYSVSTHDVAPKTAFYGDVSYQDDNVWQKQSARNSFGQQVISQDVAYRRTLPTDVTSLYNLNNGAFGNPEVFTPNTSNGGGYGSSSMPIASHFSTCQSTPRQTNYTNYTNLEPSTISSPVQASPQNRNPAYPTCLKAPVRRRRRGPSKINNRRGRPSRASTPCIKTPKPPPCLAPVIPESDPNPDPYEDFVKRYTTILDDEEQQSSDDLDPPEGCEKSSLNTPSACHVNHDTTPDGPPPCIGHCCSIRPVLDDGLEEEPQPQTVSLAGSETRQKRQNPGFPNRIRKNASTKKRRADPRQLYFCIIPTCKCSIERDFEGFPTPDDFARHRLIHEDPQIVCRLCSQEGILRKVRRSDNYRSHLERGHKLSKHNPYLKKLVEAQRVSLPEPIHGENAWILPRQYRASSWRKYNEAEDLDQCCR